MTVVGSHDRSHMPDTFEEKTRRNFRVKARYDELMREGKHGHYETMFRVVREEVEHDRKTLQSEKEQTLRRHEKSC